jgi:hypothetical protein
MTDVQIIKMEQDRFEREGYDTVLTPVEIVVSDTLANITCGNDSYVLCGIRPSDIDVVDDASRVSLIAPNACLEATQRTISAMGNAINRLFRRNITIKTSGQAGWQREEPYPPFTLEFIKITPIKRFDLNK